jgi:photosystem II stability/assembly factor-like uncharacterized protein
MSLCGDGVLAGMEECDGDPGQMLCTDYSLFDMGRIGCAACRLTKDTCVSFSFDYIQPTTAPEVHLNSIWSDGNGSGYAVGNRGLERNGIIIHFEYTHWTEESVPAEVSDKTLHGVWGSETGQVYAVGAEGAILTRRMEGWIKMANPVPESNLNAVWGYQELDKTTIFAVGDDCTILKLEASNGGIGAWTREIGPKETGAADDCEDLGAVSGNGPGQIYAVGKRRVLHRNASGTWTRVIKFDSITSMNLDDIWVIPEYLFIARSEDFFGIGDKIYSVVICTHLGMCWDMKYDGKEVFGIWGSGPHDLLAVTNDAVFHSNGTLGDGQWGKKFEFPGAGFRDISGSGAFDLFIASEHGILYGNLPWRKMHSAPRNLFSTWAGETAIYAAGERGVFLLDNNGSWGMALNLYGEDGRIHGLWGVDGSHLLAVGYKSDNEQDKYIGHLFMYDGQTWTASRAPDGSNPNLTGVWASDMEDVFVVGHAGIAWHYHPGTDTWISMAGTDPSIDLLALWGSDIQNLFAVGSAGTILRYVGGAWMKEAIPGIGDNIALRAIWGTGAENIFAVGDYGTILHYTGMGEGWELMESPTFANLADIGGIITADGQTKLFAVGEDGVVLYYDGIAWSDVRTITTVDFYSVWVTPTDAFMVGNSGHAYRLRHDLIQIPSFE